MASAKPFDLRRAGKLVAWVLRTRTSYIHMSPIVGLDTASVVRQAAACNGYPSAVVGNIDADLASIPDVGVCKQEPMHQRYLSTAFSGKECAQPYQAY